MTIKEDIDNVIDPILAVFVQSLQTRLNGHVAIIYVAGFAQISRWAGLPYEGPPAMQAIDYASKHAARLVTGMDEVTKDRLAQVISNGIKEKRGIPGLARDIKREFADMTKSRSELIAKNETADALGQAFEDRGKELGIEGKEWVTAGDDKVSDGCLENEAAGVIPFNRPFPSGHMRPPRFPGCRCAAAPVMIRR